MEKHSTKMLDATLFVSGKCCELASLGLMQLAADLAEITHEG